MFDNIKERVKGHVLIRDKVTGEVLVDKFNSINFENFSVAIAQTLSNRPYGWIQDMCFGNGGATVSGTGIITYLPPNVVGQNAELYNETYYKVVNDQSALNTDPTNNYITVNHIVGTTYADIVVTCTLELGEPAGQQAFDTATSLNDLYVFNELGLRAYDVNGAADSGNLLTHVIFSPIQKSLTRQIEIVYTIRIQTSS
jgi:hypothetical protein